jgi:hypothetical protein
VVNAEFRIHEYLVVCAAVQCALPCFVCREIGVVKTSADNRARYLSRGTDSLHAVDVFGTEIAHTSITTPHKL